MSQTTLVKLIVITNCKDLNHFFFWLAATSPTCVAKVTYILVLAKNLSLLATGCEFINVHLWYFKKWKDYIDIWTFYDQIPQTSRTAHVLWRNRDEDSTETCCDRHLEIPGVSNNPLKHWSKRKPMRKLSTPFQVQRLNHSAITN